MQIHVTSAAVVGRQMEYNLDAIHRGARNARLAEVGFDERDAAGRDVVLDIAEVAARKVVNHMDLRAAFQELIYEMRTYEGCSARDENFLMIPDDALPSDLLPPLP